MPATISSPSSADRGEHHERQDLRPRQPRHHVGPPDLDRRRDRLDAGAHLVLHHRQRELRPHLRGAGRGGQLDRAGHLQRAGVHRQRADHAAAHAQALSGRDAQARRRDHHQRSLARHRPPLRHHHGAAGVPQGADRRLHAQHQPSARRRRLGLRLVGGGGVSRGPPPADLQALRRGPAERAADGDHPHQRAGARAGDRRRDGQCRLQRGRRARDPGVHGRVRAG